MESRYWIVEPSVVRLNKFLNQFDEKVQQQFVQFFSLFYHPKLSMKVCSVALPEIYHLHAWKVFQELVLSRNFQEGGFYNIPEPVYAKILSYLYSLYVCIV